MARPLKDGLDYFYIDVAMDDKFCLVEADFGITGFGILVRLLQSIYGQAGYYIEWNDRTQRIFSSRIGMKTATVEKVIGAALREGVFDSGIYNTYGILTSEKIQKTYFAAVYKRKEVKVHREFLLVNVFDYKNLVIIGTDINNSVDDIKNTVDSGINGVSDIRSTQSRVEKSRVEKSRVERVACDTRTHAHKPTLEQVLDFGKTLDMTSDPELFFNYYEARGWLDKDGNPITNWQAALRGWERREAKFAAQASTKRHDSRDPRATSGSSLDFEALDAFIDNQFSGEGNS